MRTMLAALQERTQYRPTTDTALMKLSVSTHSLAHPSVQSERCTLPFSRAMGGPYRGKLLEFGASVLAHLPEVGKGSGNPAQKLG